MVLIDENCRCKCPAHGNPGGTTMYELRKARSTVANAIPAKEYAFEVCIFKISWQMT